MLNTCNQDVSNTYSGAVNWPKTVVLSQLSRPTSVFYANTHGYWIGQERVIQSGMTFFLEGISRQEVLNERTTSMGSASPWPPFNTSCLPPITIGFLTNCGDGPWDWGNFLHPSRNAYNEQIGENQAFVHYKVTTDPRASYWEADYFWAYLRAGFVVEHAVEKLVDGYNFAASAVGFDRISTYDVDIIGDPTARLHFQVYTGDTSVPKLTIDEAWARPYSP